MPQRGEAIRTDDDGRYNNFDRARSVVASTIRLKTWKATRHLKTRVPHKTPTVVAVIFGKLAKGQNVTSRALHAAIVDGFPIKIVPRLAIEMGIHAEDLADRIGISRTSYRRYLSSRKNLSGLQSDALFRYAFLLKQAAAVFDGDRPAVRNWLKSAQTGLGGEAPLEFARTTIGFREVEKLLIRIDHGVYA